MDNIVLSHHIFLFPFRIQYNDKKPEENLYDYCIKNIAQNENWHNKKASDKKIKPAEINNDYIWHYNEYIYFHEHVRKFLFNDNKDDVDTEKSHTCYEWELGDNPEFTICIKNNEKPVSFTLGIQKIELHLFQNEFGILSFFFNNYCYDDFESILLINDFGRRIFPQFMGARLNENDIDKSYCPVDTPKDKFFADRIIVKAGSLDVVEVFDNRFLENPGDIYAKYIQQLLATLKKEGDGLFFRYIIDDRMYTICWYGNSLFSDLSRYVENEYGYQVSEQWYKYIFVDGKETGVNNKTMMKSLINHATYARHIGNGTLFGISRYSFVALTDPVDLSYGFSFSYHILRNHIQTMYYKLFLLLLAQRASILTFSNELAKLSHKIKRINKNGTNKSEAAEINLVYERLKKLKAEVVHFENSLWFEEVTAQEQGIELYQLARKNMDLEIQFSKLKEGINDLYDYFELEIQHRQDNTMLKLTIIATFFFTVTLLVAFWTFIAGLTPLFQEGKAIYIPQTIAACMFISFLVVFYFTRSGISNVMNPKKKSEEIDGKTIWKIIRYSFKIPAILITAIAFLILIIIWSLN